MRNAFFFAGVLAICLGGQSAAQSSGRNEIDIHVEDKDLAELMDEIGRSVGKTIIVHPDIDERVTITLRRVSWRIAVDVIAERHGCKVTVLPGGLLGMKQPRKISIRFTNANLRTALMLLADYAGASIVLGPDVQGTVTADLQDVEYMAAMRAIVHNASSGKLAILGTTQSFRVGNTRSKEAVKNPPAPARMLKGRLIKLSKDSVLIRKDGKDVRVYLPATKSLRSRLQTTLKTLRKGDRVVLTYRSDGKKRIVADLIAQSRK